METLSVDQRFLDLNAPLDAAQLATTTDSQLIDSDYVVVETVAVQQEPLPIVHSQFDSTVTAVQPFPAVQNCHGSMLGHIFSLVKVSTSVLQAFPTGAYLMQFAPDIEAGIRSGALVLSKNAYGYTVSVGDGTKLVASGGLVRETLSATRCISAVTSALDFCLQWHYLAGIHESLQQQTHLLQRMEEDRLMERFGKLKSMEQKLSELLQDLRAGEDVKRLTNSLDTFCAEITDALHILLPLFERFAEGVQAVLSDSSITTFTKIVEEFHSRRPEFNMLFEYLRLNVFVRFLKCSVAACANSDAKVQELAGDRLRAAFDCAESLRHFFVNFEYLVAKMKLFATCPGKHVNKLRAAYYSLGGHLKALEEDANTLESWVKECSSQLNVIAYIREGKVVVQWNAETCEAAALA
eukprot:GILK01004862.1.p1 GENE.GILK01004862.1~~GILK01004862.1.p1  ORF type:complete len:409 (-),score=47.29 GILK01004862.1:182-1408(-)